MLGLSSQRSSPLRDRQQGSDEGNAEGEVSANKPQRQQRHRGGGCSGGRRLDKEDTYSAECSQWTLI